MKGIDMSRFELPVQYNERVQHYIDLFTQTRRNTFATWLRRMGRYRTLIEEKLELNGLPRELVYLPLIESMYDPNAGSRAGAVGLWQFMAGTARAEGLRVDQYVDERRDPIRSTDAALRHLSGLYNHFGSWYLTAAAYNSGSGRIGRLLKEYGYSRGQDDAFWALQDALPRETRDYVPQLLAATIVGENPDHFGFDVALETPVRHESVTVPPATDLRAVARAANTSYETIKLLNSHYIKGMTPPNRYSEVRVPPGSADNFQVAFSQIPKAERTRTLDWNKTHVVKSGETLSGIAAKYGTSVEAIQKVNRIKRPDRVGAGRKLVIPAT
jgi:membrane-bound lytic murein transglycosylase D